MGYILTEYCNTTFYKNHCIDVTSNGLQAFFSKHSTDAANNGDIKTSNRHSSLSDIKTRKYTLHITL